ncbi:MAG TPA: glycosyltransferase family 4 protein, partial [Vicinamibacterales bacterium]|nr:glycosyltransferase family 4 protein [Vicinamibacterales bacterium]
MVPPHEPGPRLLLISPTDYQSAVVKGVVSLLADFDEGGFFERVVIAFPFARTSTTARVSARVVAIDMGTDWLPFGGRFRWLRRMAAPVHLFRVVAALVKRVRTEQIDIIRATDPCFSGAIAWTTARLSRRPLCVSIHADFDKRHALGGALAGATILGSRRAARAMERFVLRRADMVMPIRESLRAYALGLGARPDRIRIVPHGADLRPFVEPSPIDVMAQFGVGGGKKIISFAGRLVRENYVDDVLALARRLGEHRRDFTLLIVGGGLEEARFRAVVSSDPILREVVRFAGFQPRNTVAAVRQASAVSLCLMGGFSLIEACAAASPVVAYDVEWHSELVKDAMTGYLVPEHDLARLTAVV